MIFPQSIRLGDTGRCDQNGLGSAEKWVSLSPWRKVVMNQTHEREVAAVFQAVGRDRYLRKLGSRPP
jgi:hypothetical protein